MKQRHTRVWKKKERGSERILSDSRNWQRDQNRKCLDARLSVSLFPYGDVGGRQLEEVTVSSIRWTVYITEQLWLCFLQCLKVLVDSCHYLENIYTQKLRRPTVVNEPGHAQGIQLLVKELHTLGTKCESYMQTIMKVTRFYVCTLFTAVVNIQFHGGKVHISLDNSNWF